MAKPHLHWEIGIDVTKKNEAIRDQAMDRLKQDLAKEMGLWNLVEKDGWGALPAKDCGRIGGKMAARISPNLIRKIATEDEEALIDDDFLPDSQRGR